MIINDTCNFYRESERQRVYLHNLHCLMDCSKPALFQTVPGIDDLQAFEELKEAWYKSGTANCFQNDQTLFSKYGHVKGYMTCWKICLPVFLWIFRDFSMKSYAVPVVLGRGDQ